MAKLVIRYLLGDANNIYTGFADYVAYVGLQYEE